MEKIFFFSNVFLFIRLFLLRRAAGKKIKNITSTIESLMINENKRTCLPWVLKIKISSLNCVVRFFFAILLKFED